MTNYVNSSVTMSSPLNIQKIMKSSGILQEFDPAKLIKVLEWACENTMVDPYELYRKIKPQLVNEMTTNDIQSAAIKVAADNITKDSVDYQYVASNLAMFGLRKAVYSQFEPIPLYDLIQRNVGLNVYDREVLDMYTKEEIEYVETNLNHEYDFTMTYAGTMQLIEKYLVRNRSTGEVYETPQYAYAMIALTLHQNEPKDERRLENVLNFYNNIATKKISLPTPIMAGARTPTRQFSSCVVIEAGDSLDSINETSGSIIKYISKRAGIGLHGGAIRAEGSKIGHGEVKHTGVLPFWKHFQTAVKSCVTPSTKVYIKDLGVIDIDYVKPGMMILTSSDGINHTFREVLDKWDSVVPVEKQLVLEFNNGTSIKCSDDHKIMFIEDGKIQRVLPLEITPEHSILVADGTRTNLKSISKNKTDIRYVDITVEGTESFFAIS